jgi:glyoxylase-like metal-dependent hydrolase (beta-lactamase superfamily II)
MENRAGVPDTPAAGLAVEQIRDHLYLIRGGGRTIQVNGKDLPTAGTSAVLVTDRGTVLVDTKLPGWGAPLLETIRSITDRPLTTIVNTHPHMDHVGGNPELADRRKDSVEIIAHEITAELMREMRPVSGGPRQPDIFRDSEARGLPTRTFRNRLSVGSGPDRVELRYFGRAHTGGDTWVFFPELSVVHCGDLFAHKAVPPLDLNNGASGLEYPRTIESALTAMAGTQTLITGHYHQVLELTDLETYGVFVRTFVEAVQAAKRSRATIEEFVESWRIPNRFLDEGYVDFSHLRSIRADVEAIWNETP